MWVIIDDETSVAVAEFDTVLEVGALRASDITTYPAGRGGFVSATKVNKPIKLSVKVIKGGSHAVIEQVVRVLELCRKSLKTLTVVTPFEVYLSMSLTGFSHTHSISGGANTLTAALEFTEIQVPQNNPEQNVLNPSLAGFAYSGIQQTKPFDISGFIKKNIKGGFYAG